MRRAPVLVGCTLLFLAWTVSIHAERRFHAILSGAQQAPAVASSGTGIGTVVLNTAETQITVNLTFSGLTSNASMAHIHGPAATGANAGVLFDFSAATPAATSGTIPPQTFAITAAQVTQLAAGQFYFNVHSVNFGGGEIRGQILTAPHEKYTATLSGAQQVPPVASSGTGTGTVLLNAAETQILVDLTFSGLTSNATMAHIHGPAAAGGNAGVLFDFTAATPAATSGTIPRQTFAITAAQVAQLKAGQFYFNVHTVNFGGGEIRGQIGLAPAYKFSATMDGEQQVPSVSSAGTGSGTVLLNAAKNQITVNMTFSGLSSAANGAHIHGPAEFGANGGIMFDLSSVTPAATSGTIPEQTFAITLTQVAELEAGQLYFNIHSVNFGGGEIRGQILQAPARKFVASFSGSQEVPAVATAATGVGTVVLNGLEEQIAINGNFSSLSSNATAAHIHGPAAAGANADILFGLEGVPASTTGVIPDQSVAITADQVTQLESGLHYFNVHSVNHTGGEIRGQLGELPMLTVMRGGTGSASAPITSAPAGISCGADCAESTGSPMTLTAGAAAAGSFFAGWTGGGCQGLTCGVPMGFDTTVTAVYTLSSSSIAFTDDPLTQGTTTVKAVHITELRNAINTLRAANGLGAFVFTDPSLGVGTPVKGVHITELRTALNAVYTQRSRPVPAYTDPSIAIASTLIQSIHIAELRMAVRLIE
jgi:Cu/Zn superoxide dismutase